MKVGSFRGRRGRLLWVTPNLRMSWRAVDTAVVNCDTTPRANLLGDVAQLGERCLRKAEAEGSNPFISTMSVSAGPFSARDGSCV